jgi:hypothetical protein
MGIFVERETITLSLSKKLGNEGLMSWRSYRQMTLEQSKQN